LDYSTNWSGNTVSEKDGDGPVPVDILAEHILSLLSHDQDTFDRFIIPDPDHLSRRLTPKLSSKRTPHDTVLPGERFTLEFQADGQQFIFVCLVPDNVMNMQSCCRSCGP
jgi:hypothetical protein